jgi:hypothetical protein
MTAYSPNLVYKYTSRDSRSKYPYEVGLILLCNLETQIRSALCRVLLPYLQTHAASYLSGLTKIKTTLATTS